MNSDSKYFEEYYDYVLGRNTKKDIPKPRQVVYSIISNLTDRRGIKNGFSDIDEDVWDEMIETLTGIVEEKIK